MTKSSRFSPNHRVLIALPSPNGLIQTERRMPSGEKCSTPVFGISAERFLGSHFQADIHPLRRFSRNIETNAAAVLWSPGCVGEENGKTR